MSTSHNKDSDLEQHPSNERGASTEIRFEQLDLGEQLHTSLAELGYERPTQIQARAIPLLLEGRDLVGRAQTGTGKTAAFALPVLRNIEIDRKRPQALVLAPTRELALQVCEAVRRYGRQMRGLQVLPVYGGQGMTYQLKSLKRGVHVVVGTPGRVLDHLERGTLDLRDLRTLVLDEADEMLRMGFIDEVERILEQTPEDRQTALFSATMPAPIKRIAERFTRDALEVHIESEAVTVESIEQQHVLVSGDPNKVEAMTRLLEVEDFDAMIVFVRTRVKSVEVAEKLEARGHGAEALHGDMTQQLRQRTVDRFKAGEFDVLVCTDVAARGLDVPRITHVLNYDIPSDTEAYVHRIGRTGRAGRAGKAILFAGRRERRMLQAIERATGTRIERLALPTGRQIGERRVASFKQTLSATVDAQQLDYFHAVVESFCEETGHDATTAAAALAYLYQRERPFEIPEVQLEDRGDARRERRDRRDRDERRGPRDRGPRGDRPEREGRGDRGPRPRTDHPMVNYRVKVGREHGLEPRHLVGAIANEAGLESRYIGAIRIGTHRSTVELPAGMPDDVLRHLKKVWVCGVQLQMAESRDGDDRDDRDDRPRKPRRPRDDRFEDRPRTHRSAPRDRGDRDEGRPRRPSEPREDRGGHHRDDRPRRHGARDNEFMRDDRGPRDRDERPSRDDRPRRDDRPGRDDDRGGRSSLKKGNFKGKGGFKGKK